MDGSEEVRYGGMVKSAVRVIEILEFFEAERRALKVSDIVEGLRMPQSSVSTLMKTLAAQGYVEFEPQTRRYRPAARLAFLGHWALGGPGNVEQVQILMRTLAERSEESVLLGAQKGLFMQYLSIIESPHNLRFSLRPGIVRPLHGSGIGIMLLTRRTDEEIRRIVRRHRAEFGAEDGWPDEERTLENVRQARAQGYIETYGIASRGAGTICTLLPMPGSGPCLGIALGGPLSRLDGHREELREVLIRTVREFEDDLTGAPASADARRASPDLI
ncbi:MAG: IclR family transcriptional regulator [Pseudomonadota bacterium]|nr:IclR family transcriptional regulator [Pseudomonadota bacterium]